MANLPRVPFVVQLLSRIWLFSTPWTAACQTSLSFTISGSLSNSCPLSWWCHPTISSSVVPFSSCLQFFPASGSFPMSQQFASGGQSIWASTSASVLPMDIQGCFPLGWTALIFLIKNLLQHLSLNASILWGPAFFTVQLSHPLLTIGKTIALTYGHL